MDLEQYLARPWRIGGSIGRTIYVQLGDRPSKSDPVIGMLDEVALAEEAVCAHNECLGRSRESAPEIDAATKR